jgi:dTDP-4-dehydrorhamnose reductase
VSPCALVTGAAGQLGRELADRVPEGWQTHFLDREALDIGDAAVVSACLDRLRPHLVINAAAYTAVDRAEQEPAAAAAVNAEGPANLAAACAARGARLIHVSTDFVFDGAAGHPYAPDSPTAPLGVYGQTKLAGEQALRRDLPSALVVRTGWVYSKYGSNFLRTMLRLMAERDELAVVADQVGTPTWAGGLARLLWRAAETDIAGTYHWSDAGVASWYDFAVAIAEEALACGLLERAPAVRPIATADYPTPARRPAYSVLDKSATWRDLPEVPVHWRVHLRQTLQELKDAAHA